MEPTRELQRARRYLNELDFYSITFNMYYQRYSQGPLLMQSIVGA